MLLVVLYSHEKVPTLERVPLLTFDLISCVGSKVYSNECLPWSKCRVGIECSHGVGEGVSNHWTEIWSGMVNS